MLAGRPAAGLVVISLMTEKTYKIGREGGGQGGDWGGEERRGRKGRGEMTTKEWEGDWTVV